MVKYFLAFPFRFLFRVKIIAAVSLQLNSRVLGKFEIQYDCALQFAKLKSFVGHF